MEHIQLVESESGSHEEERDGERPSSGADARRQEGRSANGESVQRK